jgi:hemolysin III
MFLYFNSAMYHGVTNMAVKVFFRVMDHLSVLVFMTGSSAPFIIHGMPPWAAAALLGFLGLLVAGGCAWSFLFWESFLRYEDVAYVGFAAIACGGASSALGKVETDTVVWFFKGILMYALGVPFFHVDWIPYTHTVFHGFVVLGTYCHYRAIFTQ